MSRRDFEDKFVVASFVRVIGGEALTEFLNRNPNDGIDLWIENACLTIKNRNGKRLFANVRGDAGFHSFHQKAQKLRDPRSPGKVPGSKDAV
jgi:hypothetical protein